MKQIQRITLLLVLFTCFTIIGKAQQIADDAKTADLTIPRNAKIYIAPMDGFENYMAAAIRKKEVPVILVAVPDAADFQISGTHEKKSAGWAKTIFMGDSRSSASASIQVVNMKTQVIVYADSSNRGSANNGERSTAEKLAKYLKKKIEDDEKKARKG